ncbi:MAG: AAA family ATPase [Microscillaceae bacterium]|nr:AAA family ATPase [Microscillaceae bacterium]
MSRFIISGAPGSGKSALLTALKQKGYFCLDNDIDLLIQEQSQLMRGIFPWTNMRYFAQSCLGRMWKTHERSTKHNQIVFFNQSIPDLMAYLRSEQIPIIPIYLDTYHNCHFYPVMFLCPISNTTFPEENLAQAYTVQEMLHLEELIKDTYTQLGFEIVSLTSGNPQKSLMQVIDKICMIEDEIQSD